MSEETLLSCEVKVNRLEVYRRTGAVWRSWRSICVWFPSPGCWEGWRSTVLQTDISARRKSHETNFKHTLNSLNVVTKSSLKRSFPARYSGAKITLMQMPQPMHRDSEIHTILLCGVTSIHSLPEDTHGSHLDTFLSHSSLCRRCDHLHTHPYGRPGSSSCTPDGIS